MALPTPPQRGTEGEGRFGTASRASPHPLPFSRREKGVKPASLPLSLESLDGASLSSTERD